MHPLNKDNNYHDDVILNQVSDKLQLPKSFCIPEKSSMINNAVETSIIAAKSYMHARSSSNNSIPQKNSGETSSHLTNDENNASDI